MQIAHSECERLASFSCNPDAINKDSIISLFLLRFILLGRLSAFRYFSQLRNLYHSFCVGMQAGILGMKVRQFKRRFTVVMSADVVAYSRLMGSDEDLTLATLQSYRALIAEIASEERGRLFGVAGDSWMAEFGDAVSAVNTAAGIQRRVELENRKLDAEQQVHYRIGIHTGDVLDAGDDLFGDNVNISARLQELAQPGGLVVSSAVLAQVLGKTEIAFEPLGPKRLKNIGATVNVFSANLVEVQPCARTKGSAVDLSKPVPGFLGKPAIAVLPFENLGDPDSEEYLAEGLAEDIVIGLSNVRWIPVISHKSSFVFRMNALEPRAIGEALGARYLVNGSVRRAADHVRIAINLIDSESGYNLWSQHYDFPFDRVFDVQDEIIGSIVNRLDTEVDRAEQIRAGRRENLDTWELVRRGVWHMKMLTKFDAAKSRELFEEALKRDPGSTEAKIQLAWWVFWDGWTKARDHSVFRQVEKLAREVLADDPRDARGKLMLGIARLMMHDPVTGRADLSEAVKLNPSLSPARACLGSTFILDGEPEKGIDPLLVSIRLNPHDHYSFHYLGELGMAYYMQENWEKACEFARRSLQLRPGYWYAKSVLAGSLARSGRVDKAATFVEKYFESVSIKHINWLPFVDKKWNQYIASGLEMTGCRLSE